MYPSDEEIVSLQRIVRDMKLQSWLEHELFSLRWWVVVILTIGPWFVWWKLVDRKKIAENFLFGMLIIFFSVIQDISGMEFVLWSYPYELVKMVPLLEFDFGFIPVAYMLVYQYYGRWKPFVYANLLMSAVFAFVFEPLYVKAGLYVLHNWSHFLSFPLYILMAVAAKWLTESVFRLQYENRVK